MGMNNAVFMEVIEWFDDTGKEIAHRIPETGSGEIKYGAQLTVRESQTAVFFYEGKAYDAFGAGRHTLTTLNIPIITKILSLPWGFTSPLRAEVCFVNMKTFPDLTWGTRDPVAFKDSQLGPYPAACVRGLQHKDRSGPLYSSTPLWAHRTCTQSPDIEDYLRKIIVSRFNDYLGEKLDSILNLPGNYEAISEGLVKALTEDFSRLGVMLTNLYINSITPPLEVQKAIDDKTKLGIFDDLNKLLKMKTAMALENASQNPGQGGAGMGMGLGFMMPAMYSDLMKNTSQAEEGMQCPDCRNPVAPGCKVLLGLRASPARLSEVFRVREERPSPRKVLPLLRAVQCS